MRAILLGGGIALLISLLGTRVVIRWFTQWGYGQEIRDDGPTSHHTKRGTPTMGGVVIILAAVVGYFAAKLITWTTPSASALLLLFLFVGMGLVGFLDDFIKISKQRSLGLRSKAKMAGQTVIALVFGGLALSPWLADENGRTPASEKVSFLREIEWLVLPSILALLLIWLFVAGFSNAVNLTDGLDGLAAGASVMVFGAYMLVNIWQNNQFCQEEPSATGSASQSISRRNDTFSEAGVRPLSSSSSGESARTPKTTAITVWPIIFALLRRPRLRCLEILMKSSRKPTRPRPTKRKSSSSAEAEGRSWLLG